MKIQRFNWQIWTGFLLSIFAFLSYPLVFVNWAVTRDFPWANLLLFAIAALLLFITFLSDPNLDAIRRYDLVHAGQGINGHDIARPAEFLLDSSGTVRWRMLTENYWVRATPQQILDAAKALR